MKTLQHYINGARVDGTGRKSGVIHNPATGEEMGRVPFATLEEVGNDLGVTRERVRQIQIEALKRLREILEREGFSVDTVFE